ncbi:MAG: AarF/ABC1/UbiB kinase family protein [Pseudomonadota bacterium]
MTERSASRPYSVPSSRISRLSHFGSLATGIAGNMAVNGMREMAQGRRPELRDLLLTPANISRFADQLARMRGAAMKVGQLISMDTGDVLPPELAEILARLRANADYMPPKQLRQVLNREWGTGWLGRFQSFDVVPIAAASIGQVHRAQTRDGRDLAIKIQYPGVRRSIDSDVDNVASMIRMAGLVPDGVDVSPFLAEAKRQLRDEADYLREAEQLLRFGDLLSGDMRYIVPVLQDDLTTGSVLAMSFLPGVGIESLAEHPRDVRDRVTEDLIDLVLREMFEFGWMQSDPNFANYRFDPDSGRIVLLDFGAAMPVDRGMAGNYRELFRAGLAQDRARVRDCAMKIGFFDGATRQDHQDAILDMMEIAFDGLRRPGLYDFSDTEIVARLREMGTDLGRDSEFVHIPPMATFFLHRKLGGMYLLANRLGARLDLQRILGPWLEPVAV